MSGGSPNPGPIHSIIPAVLAPPASVGRQFPLFAIKARIEFPPLDGADSSGEAEADDTHRYYIKGDSGGRPTRASEWIATHLAEEVNVGAPTPAIVERLDGTLVFGSRRIAGVADKTVTARFLTTTTQSNVPGTAASGLKGVLSSIYAFDMFVNNVDRHLGNYLSIDDAGTRRLYAFDFSRSLLWNWPWNGFPAPGTNTRQRGALLRRLHGFDTAAAGMVLDRLAGLAPATIESFINSMPSDWMSATTRAEFAGFWSGSQRTTRLQTLRDGLLDGSLL